MATFAAFGGFATLVLASFSGTRRDKLVAHTALALAGSVLLTIGTAVSSSTALAAIVTVPVVFVVFFAGVAGPNAASGVTAALLAYVLPAASPGTMSMVPDRLAGWWLASVVGTAAVLRDVAAAARPTRCATRSRSWPVALADGIDAMLRGEAVDEHLDAWMSAKHELLARFTATPFRPTRAGDHRSGARQRASSCSSGAPRCSSTRCRSAATCATRRPIDRELLAIGREVLRDAGALFAGERRARPSSSALERLPQAEHRPRCATSRPTATTSGRRPRSRFTRTRSA